MTWMVWYTIFPFIPSIFKPVAFPKDDIEHEAAKEKYLTVGTLGGGRLIYQVLYPN